MQETAKHLRERQEQPGKPLAKKPERSYAGLREDLRCANAEAQGYLEELTRLRDELKAVTADRDRWRVLTEKLDGLVFVLTRALKDAQSRLSSSSTG